MTDNKIICQNCGQENEPEYAYCINCGTELKPQTNGFYGSAEYTPPPQFNMGGGYNYSAYNPYPDYSQIEPTINDVDTKKIQAYVGEKKQNYFLQAFITIKRTARKIFFNWPIVLLGILVGSPYATSWFYYRKMYKVGLIISIALFLLAACSVVVNYDATVQVAETVFETAMSGDEAQLQAFLQTDFKEVQSSATTIFNNIIDIFLYGGIVSVSMYSNYMYLKDVTRKIKKSDQKIGPQNEGYYKKLGGTSTVAAILIPTLFFVLTLLISAIPYLVALINII